MKARSLSMKFLLMERPQAEHSGSIGQPSIWERITLANYFTYLVTLLFKLAVTRRDANEPFSAAYIFLSI